MMSPASAPKKIKIPIKVVDGGGVASFQITGFIHRIIITPPDDSASYSWSILDEDGNGVDGVNSPMTGPQAINVNDAVIGSNEFSISGASADGQYAISIYFEDRSR